MLDEIVPSDNHQNMSGMGRSGGGSTSRRQQEQEKELLRKQTEEAQARAYLAALKADAATQRANVAQQNSEANNAALAVGCQGAKGEVQTHRCIDHIDVEAQSIPKNIISPDPSHQGETFVKLVERHLSFEPIDKLLATIFDGVPEVGSLEKSMAAKAKTDEPACIAPKGIIHLCADEPKEMSQRAWHQKAKLYLFADHSSKEVRPDGRDIRMERTHEWKVRPNERDVRMEGTPEWKVHPDEGDV
ncbi:hypothetical protein Tco_1130216 [Tanacetum coccineum]